MFKEDWTWKLFIKMMLFKILWNVTSRKFQSVIMAVILCLIFSLDTWIIVACLGGYAGINLIEKWSVK